MSRPLWFVSLIKKTFPGLFTAAKLTRAPGLKQVAEYGLFKGDDLMYLAKDRLIPVNRTVPDPGNMVLPSQVVEHFIGEANYHWIMDKCICRDSLTCQDYPIDLGCLFLGEAALGINPKLGRRVSREEARAHVSKCREQGLVHVIGRNKLDSVWLGVQPGHKLLTVCNCCPCCCIWRAAPYLAPEISRKVTRMPGLSVRVTELCEGCGTCLTKCFVQAIHLADGRAAIGDECKGCGRCVEACPHEAIELKIENSQFVKDAIDRIAPLVDVS